VTVWVHACIHDKVCFTIPNKMHVGFSPNLCIWCTIHILRSKGHSVSERNFLVKAYQLIVCDKRPSGYHCRWLYLTWWTLRNVSRHSQTLSRQKFHTRVLLYCLETGDWPALLLLHYCIIVTYFIVIFQQLSWTLAAPPW